MEKYKQRSCEPLTTINSHPGTTIFALEYEQSMSRGKSLSAILIVPKGKNVSEADFYNRLFTAEIPSRLKSFVGMVEKSASGVYHLHGVGHMDRRVKSMSVGGLTLIRKDLRDINWYSRYCVKDNPDTCILMDSMNRLLRFDWDKKRKGYYNRFMVKTVLDYLKVEQ